MPGGGSGGGTPAETKTTTVRELSPEQQRLMDLVIPIAENTINNPPQLFGGTTIAQQDPLQAQAQQMTIDAATNTLPGQIKQAQDAQNFLLGPVLFPESNPALAQATDAAVRPLKEAFEQTILPGIRSEAIAGGGFGGSRQAIAEGNASNALLQGIGDTSAKVQNQAFQSSLEAMTRSLLVSPQLFQSSFLPGQAIEAVGTQRRAEGQQSLNEQVQRFTSEQLIPFATAQDVAALAFGIPAGTQQSTSTAFQPQIGGGGVDPFSGALGGAGLGLSLGGPWGAAAGGLIGALGSLF